VVQLCPHELLSLLSEEGPRGPVVAGLGSSPALVGVTAVSWGHGLLEEVSRAG